MCLRVDSCCRVSLRKWAIVIAVFTVLETLGLVIAGGVYLHKGLKATDVDGPTGYIRPQNRTPFEQAFGALYLAFGALWVVCCIAYIGAVLVDRALYLIPWLVLQAITLGLGLANVLSESIALKNFAALAMIPVIILFTFFYVLVFSYYLDLQEAKRQNIRTPNYKH